MYMHEGKEEEAWRTKQMKQQKTEIYIYALSGISRALLGAVLLKCFKEFSCVSSSVDCFEFRAYQAYSFFVSSKQANVYAVTSGIANLSCIDHTIYRVDTTLSGSAKVFFSSPLYPSYPFFSVKTHGQT